MLMANLNMSQDRHKLNDYYRVWGILLPKVIDNPTLTFASKGKKQDYQSEVIRVLGAPSPFNKHIAIILANEIDYRYMGVPPEAADFVHQSLERILELQIETAQLRMIHFVPSSIETSPKPFKEDLNWYLERPVQMNELSKHSDYLNKANNCKYIFRYINEDLHRKQPFHVRFPKSEFKDPNYFKFSEKKHHDDLSRAIQCR